MTNKKLMYFGGSLVFIFAMLLLITPASALFLYPGDSPASYFTFNNEVQGENATDDGTNGAILVSNYTGDTAVFVNYSTGILNNAVYSFVDGNNESFMQTMGDESDFDFNGDAVTIAFWMWSNHGGSNQQVLNKGDCAGTGWCFDTDATDLRFRSAWMNLNTGFNVQDSAWHRVVFTYNNVSDKSTVYIDGTEEGNLALLAPADTNLEVRIGATSTGNPDWEDTRIDDFQFWRSEWNSSDVTTDWNAGVGLEAGAEITENSFNFSEITFERTSEDFVFNFTYTSADYNAISATFYYNNTAYASTLFGTGDNARFESTVETPSVSATTNVSFWWEITLQDADRTYIGNTTSNNQTVKAFLVDDCTTYTNLFMNLTVIDEATQTFLDGANDNVTVEVDLQVEIDNQFNQTFNFTNPIEICLSEELEADTALRLDAQISYESFDHVKEFYHISNTTVTNASLPLEISLFDLDILTSQEFLITFKDEDFLIVPDALIEIQRKYIGEGVYKTVEIPKTDQSGQTIGHLVLSDVIYTIVVTKEGQILATFEDVIAVCQDTSTGECTINLNAFQSGTPPSDFTNLNNLTFTLTYDDATRTFESIFSTTDGTTITMDLNVTEVADTVNDACSNSLTTASGTITCVVPGSFGNTTMRAQLFKDGEFVAEMFVFLSDTTPSDNFGGTGIILVLILFITLPLMMITERIAIVIFAILGLIFASALSLFSGGSAFGVGSVMIWFILAGAILVYKISRRKA